MNAQPIRVIPRRERLSREALLFLPDETASNFGPFIGCYAHIGQHSTGSRDYYLRDTVPADPKDADVAALLREYAQLGVPAELKILRRMPR